MENETQYKVYKAVLDMMDNGILRGHISNEMYAQLIGSLKSDLVSPKEADRESAQQMLEILLLSNVSSIHEDVVDMLKITNLGLTVKDYLLQCIKSYILELIKACKVKEMASVYIRLTAIDPAEFSTIMRDIFELPQNQPYCKTYVFNTLVDVIFEEHCQDPDILDMASTVVLVVPVTSINKELQKSLFADLKRRLYAIFPLNDEVMNYTLTMCYWEKRWIFLIRLLREHLIGQIDLLNKLLSVVESVFRSTHSEQKLKGFDCWKEFISVLSLDGKNFTTEKHIQLMVRPLKAKFSHHSALIIRKFDLFLYLLEKLQHKATLVLKDFLAFCYGSFKTINPIKGQIRGVPELWLKSAKVFLTIIGHSHESDQVCLDTTDTLTLTSPVITDKDLTSMHRELLISTVQCCKLLKQDELGNNRVNILTCMWKSLLKRLLKDGSTEVPNCGEVIQNILNHLMEDRFYWSELIIIIFNAILDVGSIKAANLVRSCIVQFVDFMFSTPLECGGAMVYKFIETMKKFDSQVFAADVCPCIFDNFSKYKASEVNIELVADIWMYISDATETKVRTDQRDFLIWPLLHVHHIADKTKKNRMFDYFREGIHNIVSKNNTTLLEIYQQLKIMLQSDPHFSEVVSRFVMLYEPQPDQKDIMSCLIEIIRLLLLIPKDYIDRKSIQTYLCRLLNTKTLSKIQDKELISNIQCCIEQLVRCGHYGVLNYKEILDKLPEDIKRLHAETFPTDAWLEVYQFERIKKSFKVREKIRRLIASMKTYKRIEKSANDDAVWPVKVNVVHETPSEEREAEKPTLKLLGMDVNTHTPLKVAGSQLKTAAPPTAAARSSNAKGKSSSRTPKKAMDPFIDEDANSQFVFVPSEVQLDKSKMTEHQKETLAKRRDDIPALYQDLTQSVSHSLMESSNTASSNDNATESKASSPGSDKNLLVSKVLKQLTIDVVGAEDFTSVESKLRFRAKNAYSPKPVSAETKDTPNGQENRKSKRKSFPVKKFSPSSSHSNKKKPKAEKAPDVDEDIIESSQQETTMLGLKLNHSIPNNTTLQKEHAENREKDTSLANGSDCSNQVVECANINAEKKALLPSAEVTGDVNSSARRSRGRPKAPVKKPSKINPSIAVPKNMNIDQLNMPVKVQEGGKAELSSTKAADQSKLEHDYCIVNSTSDSSDGFCKEVEDLMSGPEHRKLPILTIRCRSAPPVVENSSRKKAHKRKQTGRQTPIVGHKKARLSDWDTKIENNNTPVTRSALKSATDAIKSTNLTDVLETVKAPPRSKKDIKQASSTAKPTRSSPRFLSKVEVPPGVNKETECEWKDEKRPSDSKDQSEDNISTTSKGNNDIQSQDTETQGTEPLDISKDDEQLQLDLPVKVPFTEADREFAVRDTATLTSSDIIDTENSEKSDTMTEIIDSTEDQTMHEDPVTETCKNVIIELERVSPIIKDKNNDTQDMSQTQLLSSPVSGETPNKINEFLNNTSDISPIGSQESIIEKRSTLVPVALRFDSEDEQPTEPTSPDKDKSDVENTDDVFLENNEDNAESSQSKPSKFTCLKSPAIQRFSTRRKFGFNTSPSVSRIEKLMSNLKPACEPEKSSDERQEDILTFSREVPSSQAKPKCGILKRKHPDFNEESGLSPCSKRKRVNFSDPCTTSRKIFIKDDNAAINQKASDEPDKGCEKISETPQESSESSNTEQSMDPHDDMTLMGGDEPICPNLSGCEDDIQVIIKSLTETKCEDEVLKKLHEQNIKRIGDLARLSMGAILRLQINDLSVTKVFDVLWDYCDKTVNPKTQAPDDSTSGAGDKSSAMSIFNDIYETLTDTEIPIAIIKLSNLIISRQKSSKDK